MSHATCFQIPNHQLLPQLSVNALIAMAQCGSTSSDEAGEYFAMAIAVKVQAAQVPNGSLVIVPLAPPTRGSEADMSYLASVPIMFLKLDGLPQPISTYGQCFALSEGADDFDIPTGSLFKFPSLSHYVLARPSIAAKLHLLPQANAAETTSSTTGDRTTLNKKQCVRQLEDGGEHSDDKGMLKFILDLDGVRHSTRNKTDLAAREKDLGLCFRSMDPDRWEFAMGADCLLQPEDYRCMILEQGRTRSDLRHPAFTSCGLLDRIQSLAVANGSAALKMLLTGNVLVEGSEATLSLDSFRTGEKLSSNDAVCPLQNRPMVAVLQNVQIVLQVFLSGEFAGSINSFIRLLEGSERPLELVPSDFLQYSVEWVLRKFFRVVRSERSSASNDNLSLVGPALCSVYLESLFEKLAEDLADHHTRIVEEAYFRMRLVRESPIKESPAIPCQKPEVKTAIPTGDTFRKIPCANFLGAAIKAVHKDGNPYSCSFEDSCKFRHVETAGKTKKDFLELIALMPSSAQVDLTKALTAKNLKALQTGK
jgi:hypothetical protein